MRRSIFMVAVIAIASFGFMTQSASAQTNDFRFGVNVEGAFPVSDFSNTHNFGIGGNATGEYFVTPNLAPTLQVGYLNFDGKKIGVGNTKFPSLGAATLRGGLKYYIPSSPVFLQGLVGAAFMNKDRGTAFIYTPGLGVNFNNLEVAAKYEGWSKDSHTSSMIGVTVGYYF